MATTVVTYGGGEILKNVFEGVALLMNNKSGDLFRPLMMTAASIGAIWAIVRAFFAPSLEAFLGRYFFPLIVTVSIMLVPTASVHIEDVLTNHSYKVSHVPLLLAKASELISTIGFKLTRAVEKVMHTPNDTNYLATGMIFGSEAALDMGQYRLTNGELEQNMRRFCKQCVLYDIALGRYGIDDLKKSTDLFEFFKANTSKVRMISYCPPDSKVPGKCTYMSCQEAIKAMSPFFDKERDYYSKHEVLKNLPLSFQALTGLQQNQQKIIGQQLVMNTLRNEYSPEGFAKARGHIQQRSTYRVMGSLAATSLVTMRAVIEALLYSSFIFIMPMALVPGGFRFISKWLGLLIWIQMWPPFFAILSYVMQTVAQSQSESVFTGLTTAERGLSLFTSVGLSNLREDIYALAGYLSASIPFISYALLQGGVGSFIHLAGAMMTPAHAAATTAAAEQTTGNYSFANASMGQTHYGNASVFQRNMAPSLSSGFQTFDSGSDVLRQTGDESYLQQRNSDFRTAITWSDRMSESASNQMAYYDAQSRTESQAFQSSVAETERNLVDLGTHLSQGQSVSESWQTKEGGSLGKTLREYENFVQDFAKQHNLSDRHAVQLMASAYASTSVGGKAFGIGVSGGTDARGSSDLSWATDDQLSAAMRAAKSAEGQSIWNSLYDHSRGLAGSESQDEATRLTMGLHQSVDEAKSHQSSAQYMEQMSRQVQENYARVQSNDLSVHHKMDQELMRFGANDYYSDTGGVARVREVMNLSPGDAEQEVFINAFVSSKIAPQMNNANLGAAEARWQDRDLKSLGGGDVGNLDRFSASTMEIARSAKLIPGDVQEKLKNVQGEVAMNLNDSARTIERGRSRVHQVARDKVVAKYREANHSPEERAVGDMIEAGSSITNKVKSWFYGSD